TSPSTAVTLGTSAAFPTSVGNAMEPKRFMGDPRRPETFGFSLLGDKGWNNHSGAGEQLVNLIYKEIQKNPHLQGPAGAPSTGLSSVLAVAEMEGDRLGEESDPKPGPDPATEHLPPKMDKTRSPPAASGPPRRAYPPWVAPCPAPGPAAPAGPALGGPRLQAPGSPVEPLGRAQPGPAARAPPRSEPHEPRRPEAPGRAPERPTPLRTEKPPECNLPGPGALEMRAEVQISQELTLHAVTASVHGVPRPTEELPTGPAVLSNSVGGMPARSRQLAGMCEPNSEEKVYQVSDLLRMRMVMAAEDPAAEEEHPGIQVREVSDVLPRRSQRKTEKRKKSKASDTPEVHCPSVQSWKVQLRRAALAKQHLESSKSGAWHIAKVQDLKSINFLLDHMKQAVEEHLQRQAARVILRRYRHYKHRLKQRLREAEKQERQKPQTEALREEMRKLSEERRKQQEQLEEQRAARATAEALRETLVEHSKVEVMPFATTGASALGATSTSSQVLDGEDEDADSVGSSFHESSMVEEVDGKSLLQQRPPVDGATGAEGAEKRLTKETLEAKEEGQKILELVHTEDFALERFFNQLDTTPTCALPAACALPELPAPRPECPRSTNANDLEDGRDADTSESKRSLREQMRALAEQRQAEMAKQQRADALRRLRRKVGPKPSEETLSGLLSRCQGDVSRAASAFFNGYVYA
ncbi:unnamed protein product, partial [Durusdinium trenchii]